MQFLTDPANRVFYFNQSGDVGPGRFNATDDVEFVRLGLRNMRSAFERNGVWGQSQMADFRSAHEGIALVGPFDDKVHAAIRAMQAGMGGRVVDGICSMMPHAQVKLQSSGKLMICAGFQTELRNSYAGVWPRMDLINGCGPSLAATVRRLFGLHKVSG